MRQFLWFLIYLPLQLLGLPLGILGVAMATFAELAVHRKRGSSFTAGQAIQPRWFLHYWGVRPDPFTAQFFRCFPAESNVGLWMVFGPAWIASKATGFRPSLMSIPAAGHETMATFLNSRTVRMDNVLAAALPQVEQVVHMGGGFDLRLLTYTRGLPGIFEIDQGNTQRFKLEVMDRAGLEHDWITYISVDFREESWVEKLLEAGFDKTKPTYFHWESVSLYLDDAVVKDTLAKMSELCAPGSIVAQDFYRNSFGGAGAQKFVQCMGEPMKYTVDMSEGVDEFKNRVGTFLSGFGFLVTEYYPMGGDTKGGMFYAIVVAHKAPAP